MKKANPKAAKGVVCELVKGNAFLLNVVSGAFFQTNSVGLAVWRLCNGKASEEAIARSITERYGLVESRALRDVRGFLKDLKRSGMLA